LDRRPPAPARAPEWRRELLRPEPPQALLARLKKQIRSFLQKMEPYSPKRHPTGQESELLQTRQQLWPGWELA